MYVGDTKRLDEACPLPELAPGGLVEGGGGIDDTARWCAAAVGDEGGDAGARAVAPVPSARRAGGGALGRGGVAEDAERRSPIRYKKRSFTKDNNTPHCSMSTLDKIIT